MEVHRGHICTVARNLQQTMKRRNVWALSQLERKIQQTIGVEGRPESILLTLRPAILNTQMLVISYFCPESGTVLEIQCNRMAEYLRVVLKMQEILKGYDPFAKDPSGNVYQRKPLRPVEWSMVEQELSYLSDLSK